MLGVRTDDGSGGGISWSTKAEPDFERSTRGAMFIVGMPD